jgi:hypothetical protein
MFIFFVRTSFLLLGLVLAEGLVRNCWRFGVVDFDLEMWRYARELKVVSNDTQVGLEHRPSSEAKLMGVRVRTDSMGFRRPDDATETNRSPDGPVALLIGDSETLGWGVPEGDTYAALLEKARPGHRVFNAGIGNTNTSMQVHLLKSILEKLKPEWVIMGYAVNDPETSPAFDDSFHVTNFALGFVLTKFYRLAFATGPSSYLDYYRALYREGSEGWSKWKIAADELVRIGKERSFPITVLLIPEFHQPYNHGPFRAAFDQVALYLSKTGVEVIDPSQEFTPGDGSPYWVNSTDPHPNPSAHRILANALLKSRHLSVR